MKIFTWKEKHELESYDQHDFKITMKEEDLEDLIENNSERFFEGERVLIIGRQVTTNLTAFVDLLGLDKQGNAVVIELKRDKTPRETLAQLLEYASFIDNLDYEQLNTIFQSYLDEETSLQEYHSQFFQDEVSDNVAFNKSSVLIIVAQEVTREIKQTAQYLRKKGLDVRCAVFSYFETTNGERLLTTNIVVGEETLTPRKIQSATLGKIDKKQFLSSLESNGVAVFEQVFDYAEQNSLLIRWGTKGFSLNVAFEHGFVGLLFGYPPNSVFKQSIYTGFEEIKKKVVGYDFVIEHYANRLNELNVFVRGGTNLKWLIDKPVEEELMSSFFSIIDEVVAMIKERGLVTSTDSS
jgi:hypothetical protein